MINRMYDNLEYLFLEAGRLTVSKQTELTLQHCSFYFNKALQEIILNHNYRYITSDHGARQKVMSFFQDDSYEDFIDVMKYRIGDEIFYKLMPSFVVLNDGKKNYSINELFLCIQYYVDNFLLPEIEKKYLQKVEFSDSNKKYIENGISDEKYYSPSNSCKEAILSGKQFNVSSSSEKVAGMQAYSDVGKVRKNQEDAYYIGQHPNNADFKIMIVADGMGGCELGERASNTAAREMLKWFEMLDAREFYQSDNRYLEGVIRNKVDEVNSIINHKYPKAGTTLCMAIVKNDNVLMCNLGDSKGFVLNDDGVIYETRTHSYTESMLHIPANFARFHPDANIVYDCLGAGAADVGRSIIINTVPFKQHENYNVVLCSDGVSDCLNSKDIYKVVKGSHGEM